MEDAGIEMHESAAPQGPREPRRAEAIASLLERLGVVASRPADGRYHAFISYSHAADGRLAPALQRGLHKFAKPWYRAQALRVFRDETSLAATPGLWPSIATALDESANFILLASPEAAASPWVAREVDHWRTRSDGNRTLLLGLTGGHIKWDDGRADFDWEQTTALPRNLSGAFKQDPKYTDLTWAKDELGLSLSHPRFRNAVAELAAPLHRVPKDVLENEEVRQHRRTVRIARGTALTLLILTAAAVFFGLYARAQRNDARAQRRVAISRALAAEAQAASGSADDRALLLGIQAYRRAPTIEARSALLSEIQRMAFIRFLAQRAAAVTGLVSDPHGRTLIDAGDDGIAFIDPTSHRIRRPSIRAGRRPIAAVATAATAPLFATADDEGAIQLWEANRQVPVGGTTRAHPGVRTLALSSNGRLLASGTDNGLLQLWNVGSHGTLQLAHTVFSPPGRIYKVTFGPRGELVFSVGYGFAKLARGIAIFYPRTRRFSIIQRNVGPGRTGLSFAFSGHTLLVGDQDGYVSEWNVAASSRVNRIRVSTSSVTSLIGPVEGNKFIAGTDDGRIAMLARAHRQLHVSRVARENGSIAALALIRNATVLAAATHDGAIITTHLPQQTNLGSRLTLPGGTGSEIENVGIAPNEPAIAAYQSRPYSFSGDVLRLWHLPSGKTQTIQGSTGGNIAFRDAHTIVQFDPLSRRLVQFHFAPTGGNTARTQRQNINSSYWPDDLKQGTESVALSADGTRLAAGLGLMKPGGAPIRNGSRIAVWDVSRGEPIGRLTRHNGHKTWSPLHAHGDGVFDLALNQDGSLLAATTAIPTGARETVSLWNVAQHTEIATLESIPAGTAGGVGAGGLSFDDHGGLAVVDAHGGSVWRVDTKHAPRKVTQIPAGHVATAALSPDGRTLATADETAGNLTGRISLWDVATAQRLGSGLKGFSVWGFGDRGDLLVTEDENGLMAWRNAAWSADPTVLQREVCAIAGRNLTADEWRHYLPSEKYKRICPEWP
jgi:WD40 repeat protein